MQHTHTHTHARARIGAGAEKRKESERVGWRGALKQTDTSNSLLWGRGKKRATMHRHAHTRKIDYISKAGSKSAAAVRACREARD